MLSGKKQVLVPELGGLGKTDEDIPFSVAPQVMAFRTLITSIIYTLGGTFLRMGADSLGVCGTDR